MKTLVSQSLIEEIQSATKDVQTAFPNADCQKVARAAGIDPQNLVSDLDTYFYDVWSPANGVRRLSQKSAAWLCDLQADLQQSFFERYPRHAALEAAINPEDTPSFAQRLAAIDALRQCLLIYLSELL